jgi:hypothetical protein
MTTVFLQYGAGSFKVSGLSKVYSFKNLSELPKKNLHPFPPVICIPDIANDSKPYAIKKIPWDGLLPAMAKQG